MPLFEVAIPCEVFGRPRLDLAAPWYDFRICAASPGRTRVGAGFVAGTPFGLDDLVRADTMIVPACENVRDRQPPDLVEAVRAAHARGARIVSLCTGAFGEVALNRRRQLAGPRVGHLRGAGAAPPRSVARR